VTKEKASATSATRVLKNQGRDYTLHPYPYEERGGTKVASKALDVDEHAIIKTLVMEDENRMPLIVLMHGDRQVSTKSLARALGSKTITPCDPKTAEKHTGYKVGGTSPFGTRKRLPVYVEQSILSLPILYINAGNRGLLAAISPQTLTDILDPKPVNVAI
jgi:Cys-tRNA(Pro) deacylase